jgi:hypothetical protein
MMRLAGFWLTLLIFIGGSALEGKVRFGDFIIAAENTAVQVGDYTLSDTVAGHMSDTIGGTGTYSGQLTRPYLGSLSTIDELISTGQGMSLKYAKPFAPSFTAFLKKLGG